MQNKTTQHKHRTSYAIKRSNKVVKNRRNDKKLYNNDNKKDWERKYQACK